MKLTISHTIHSSLKVRIQSLVKACEADDPARFSFPFEEAELLVLAEDDTQRLISAAAFSRLEEELWECTACTHPAFRRRGCFQAVLEAGIEELPPEAELLFWINEKNTAAVRAANALGAEFFSEEHMMEYTFPAACPPVCPAACPPREETLAVSEEKEENGAVLFFQGYDGSVRISVYPGHYYLYDFEIKAGSRGLGNGKKLLQAVLSRLHARKPRPVRLQVSGQNVPALSLYKKAGFRITETLLCCLY